MADKRNDFIQWMSRQQKGYGKFYTQNTINSYCSALKNSSAKLSQLPSGIQKDLFEYSDTNEFLKVKAIIEKQPDFDEVDIAAGHRAFSAGMELFQRFLQDSPKTKIRYWTFKHKPGTGGNARPILSWVKDKNFAAMQYEYNIQATGPVTANWNAALKIREGDIIFLRGDDCVHAYGRVIPPRKKADIILSINDFVEKKDAGKYLSTEYDKVITFKESDVFYEDFNLPDRYERDNPWGQWINGSTIMIEE
ncbi:hypothetical protein K7I13_03680 [Brucepastera parasyntrophica]|uniref:hypothetical protein n=1 Tax=Brucepastera parasyntrophica TaxID=2880008 RepID=UPI002108781B|nr:hypothetical protein [Brucepastera parasyntrophica]ULQ60421.1 hypothetical protein K7I13_03680 [Brucepastera parasyntrophica]